MWTTSQSRACATELPSLRQRRRGNQGSAEVHHGAEIHGIATLTPPLPFHSLAMTVLFLLLIMPFNHFINGSSEIEVLFSDVVVFSVEDFSKAADGILQLDVLTFDSCELLSHVEVL